MTTRRYIAGIHDFSMCVAGMPIHPSVVVVEVGGAVPPRPTSVGFTRPMPTRNQRKAARRKARGK